jgi:hypothetical protein
MEMSILLPLIIFFQAYRLSAKGTIENSNGHSVYFFTGGVKFDNGAAIAFRNTGVI